MRTGWWANRMRWYPPPLLGTPYRTVPRTEPAPECGPQTEDKAQPHGGRPNSAECGLTADQSFKLSSMGTTLPLAADSAELSGSPSRGLTDWSPQYDRNRHLEEWLHRSLVRPTGPSPVHNPLLGVRTHRPSGPTACRSTEQRRVRTNKRTIPSSLAL
jgi:hypothetical protein